MPNCSTILVQYSCVQLMLMISSKEYGTVASSVWAFGLGHKVHLPGTVMIYKSESPIGLPRLRPINVSVKQPTTHYSGLHSKRSRSGPTVKYLKL